MPKSSAVPKAAPVTSSPSPVDLSESRIERLARQLDDVRKAEAELRKKKEDISARMVGLIKRNGTVSEDGKLRYETDGHRFQLIAGTNTYTSKPKMVTALSGAGMTPKQIERVVAACVKETSYEYVGVYKADVAADDDEDQAS